MKTELVITMKNILDGGTYTKTIIGNRHKIKLCTGEVINVVTDKRGNQWFVSEVETGLLLVPSAYYGFICYDPKHDVYKEKNALETVKYCFDQHLQSKKISFKEMKEKRIKQISKERK